jgi:hypothetical protein
MFDAIENHALDGCSGIEKEGRFQRRKAMGSTTMYLVPLTRLGTKRKSVPCIQSWKELVVDYNALLAASLIAAASEEKCAVLGCIVRVLYLPACPVVTRTCASVV